MPQAPPHTPSSTLPSPVVALAGWILPGAGYWLIGERTRGVVAGGTILILFVVGLLIGGVRAMQVPGYGENGGRLYFKSEEIGLTRVLRQTELRAGEDSTGKVWVNTDLRGLLGDVGNKPWSICQVLNGPVAFVGGAASVRASQVPKRDADGVDAQAPGVLSHSRINEIGVLYTAVAGLLNLIVIIDAAARAGRPAEQSDNVAPSAAAGAA